MKIPTRTLTTLGVMAAMSIVLMLLIRIPFPPAPFLEYDPADIPILISGFMFGPWWGLALTLAVSLIQGFTVSAGSGIIGVVMHFFATGANVLAAGLIYGTNKSRKTAVVALAIGVVVQTAVMAGMNLVLTPIFMNTSFDAVLEMMLPVILPFNLLKAGINAVVTFFVYKFVSNTSKKLADRMNIK